MNNFTAIFKRVSQKNSDYATYGFEKLEMAALNTFFDLAQEYDGLNNLYLISVAVPQVFLGFKSTLYMITPKAETISVVADSQSGPRIDKQAVPSYIKVTDTAYQHETSYIVPIHGKKTPASSILFHDTGNIIGIFEIAPDKDLTEQERFFIEKYVNRIGYNLYNKTLAEQNIQHLKFINNLVADIEHNVITPNLEYKYYFKKTRRYLNTNKDIENDLEHILNDIESKYPDLYAKLSGIVEGLVVINRAIFEDQERIERHYKNTSLFLESLLRPDHFLFGQYILKKKPCFLWQDIIVPQLERYKERFVEQGIIIDHVLKKHKAVKDLQIKADSGLMAQVVANLFTNATKYAKSVPDESGKMVKRFDCETLMVENFFGHGHNGVRVNTFSSGPPIDEDNGNKIFDEGFRLTHEHSVEGSGHGLHFVKNVVEVHGGIVGHKSESSGNEFYFIIPA